MDVTVNLFTSFGYFDSDAEHAGAMGEMVATVKHGGCFAIDFLNALRVPLDLVPREDGDLGGVPVRIDRWLDPAGEYVFKSITTPDRRRFVERVRLFTIQQLERLISGAGCAIRFRFGDYDGGGLTPDSPRAILAGQVA